MSDVLVCRSDVLLCRFRKQSLGNGDWLHVTWTWSPGALTEKELKELMKVMSAAGFYVEIGTALPKEVKEKE